MIMFELAWGKPCDSYHLHRTGGTGGLVKYLSELSLSSRCPEPSNTSQEKAHVRATNTHRPGLVINFFWSIGSLPSCNPFSSLFLHMPYLQSNCGKLTFSGFPVACD